MPDTRVGGHGPPGTRERLVQQDGEIAQHVRAIDLRKAPDPRLVRAQPAAEATEREIQPGHRHRAIRQAPHRQPSLHDALHRRWELRPDQKGGHHFPGLVGDLAPMEQDRTQLVHLRDPVLAWRAAVVGETVIKRWKVLALTEAADRLE